MERKSCHERVAEYLNENLWRKQRVLFCFRSLLWEDVTQEDFLKHECNRLCTWIYIAFCRRGKLTWNYCSFWTFMSFTLSCQTLSCRLSLCIAFQFLTTLRILLFVYYSSKFQDSFKEFNGVLFFFRLCFSESLTSIACEAGLFSQRTVQVLHGKGIKKTLPFLERSALRSWTRNPQR